MSSQKSVKEHIIIGLIENIENNVKKLQEIMDAELLRNSLAKKKYFDSKVKLDLEKDNWYIINNKKSSINVFEALEIFGREDHKIIGSEQLNRVRKEVSHNYVEAMVLTSDVWVNCTLKELGLDLFFEDVSKNCIITSIDSFQNNLILKTETGETLYINLRSSSLPQIYHLFCRWLKNL